MQRKIFTTGIISVLLTVGCATKQPIMHENKWSPVYRFQVGLNHGGIVENTDMTMVEDAGVDAFTGATRRGVNASARVLLPVKRNFVETGLDLMRSNQTFTYNDTNNGFIGKRNLGLTQFMLPVTYSIGLFRKNHQEGLLQIKFGYNAQFNLLSVNDAHGNMPDYQINAFSNGATLGVSTTPIQLSNGAKLGLFVDGYRGTQLYEDFYNQNKFEMPGTSFIKYGIIYQFK